MLLRRVSAGTAKTASEDRRQAVYLLDGSLSISTELGMKPLMERIAVLQERVATRPAPAERFPNGLTQREVEVLRLIGAGKSNRDIGEVLVISEGTVRRHVSNIFDKIGAANRTEVSRYATQQGLVSSD